MCAWKENGCCVPTSAGCFSLFSQSIELDPTNAAFYLNRGLVQRARFFPRLCLHSSPCLALSPFFLLFLQACFLCFLWEIPLSALCMIDHVRVLDVVDASFPLSLVAFALSHSLQGRAGSVQSPYSCLRARCFLHPSSTLPSLIMILLALLVLCCLLPLLFSLLRTFPQFSSRIPCAPFFLAVAPALLSRGEQDMAVEDLTAAIELGVKSTNRAKAFASRGFLFREMEMYEEAIEGLSQLFPSSLICCCLTVTCCFLKKKSSATRTKEKRGWMHGEGLWAARKEKEERQREGCRGQEKIKVTCVHKRQERKRRRGARTKTPRKTAREWHARREESVSTKIRKKL